jgi:hypothetical protein
VRCFQRFEPSIAHLGTLGRFGGFVVPGSSHRTNVGPFVDLAGVRRPSVAVQGGPADG